MTQPFRIAASPGTNPPAYIIKSTATVIIASDEHEFAQLLRVRDAHFVAIAPLVACSDLPTKTVQRLLDANGLALPRPNTHPTLPFGFEETASSPLEIRRLIAKAIADNRQIRINYFAAYKGGQASQRDVDPWLVTDDGDVQGYCYLRHDVRNFAMNYIGTLTLLATPRQHTQPPESTD